MPHPPLTKTEHVILGNQVTILRALALLLTNPIAHPTPHLVAMMADTSIHLDNSAGLTQGYIDSRLPEEASTSVIGRDTPDGTQPWDVPWPT
jgi:hypothetical protein